MDPNLATGIIGKSIAEVQSLEWIQKWSNVGFLAISDSNGNGLLEINEFFMRGDIVVLATPEIAGLPYVISGLVKVAKAGAVKYKRKIKNSDQTTERRASRTLGVVK